MLGESKPVTLGGPGVRATIMTTSRASGRHLFFCGHHAKVYCHQGSASRQKGWDAVDINTGKAFR